jgi:uncharacterized protein (TIGR00369 family)
MTGLELLQAIIRGEHPTAPIQTTLGFTLDAVEEGRAVFSADAAERHYNPLGTVHGGVVATLLDSAMGCAVHSTLPEGTGYTTLEFKVNLVKAITVATGRIVAEGRIVHRGSRVATAEGRLTAAADGTLLAHATTTCIVLPPRA